MADRYLLESGAPDGYLLEDGSGVLLLEGFASQQLTPSLFANANTFYTQSVAASYTLTAALYADGDTFYTQTISPGGVTLEPALYADADTFYALFADPDTFYAHVLSGSYELTPSLYGDADSFYVAVVAPAARTLAPALYSNAASFYTPALTLGGVVLVQAETFINENVFGPFSDGDVFYTPTLSRVVYLVPDADVNDGTWTNSDNGSVLFSYIDEQVVDDADYIKSAVAPASDTCKISLGNPSNIIIQPVKVGYRYKKNGAASINLEVRLLQGAAEIAAWSHSDISNSFLTAEQTLTGGQFAAIADFNDLHLEFTADQP